MYLNIFSFRLFTWKSESACFAQVRAVSASLISVHPSHPCSKPATPALLLPPSNEDLCVNNITTGKELSISFDQAKGKQRKFQTSQFPLSVVVCNLEKLSGIFHPIPLKRKENGLSDQF